MPIVDTPLLTVYRNGLTNLNGEATRLLGPAAAVLLLAPTTPGTRWQMLPRQSPAGALPLSGRLDRGNVRFRAAALAAALFAAWPPEFQGPLYLKLVRLGTDAGYELIALHNSVQPNIPPLSQAA
ncbi:MAG: hypothetical protein ACRYG7_13070 [Janthinobacterium lividum]